MSEEERQVRLFKGNPSSGHLLKIKGIPHQTDLERVGLVSVLEESVELANKSLERVARELGATYVFGVDYRISLAGEGSHKAHKVILAYGDAWR